MDTDTMKAPLLSPPSSLDESKIKLQFDTKKKSFRCMLLAFDKFYERDGTP